MSNINKVTDAIVNQGVLPLYFNPDEAVSIDILRAIYRAGIRAVEYTNRGEAAWPRLLAAQSRASSARFNTRGSAFGARRVSMDCIFSAWLCEATISKLAKTICIGRMDCLGIG